MIRKVIQGFMPEVRPDTAEVKECGARQFCARMFTGAGVGIIRKVRK
jgi:hypothetical protein